MPSVGRCDSLPVPFDGQALTFLHQGERKNEGNTLCEVESSPTWAHVLDRTLQTETVTFGTAWRDERLMLRPSLQSKCCISLCSNFNMLHFQVLVACAYGLVRLRQQKPLGRG